MSVASSVPATREGPSGGGLSDVVGLILDKGLVIDAYIRVSLVGIEILTVDARVVIASVDTYLRFAEAAGRLNIAAADHKPGVPELIYGVTAAAKSHASAPLPPAENTPQMPAAPVDEAAAQLHAVPATEKEGDR
jgi:gas vesicle structural protein